MRAWWVIAGMIVVGFWAGPASAQIFDFASCAEAGLAATCNNSDTGLTHLTYTLAGETIVASSSETFDLVNRGSGETGLGVFSGPENEIGPGDLVTLDFTSLANLGATGGIIDISSLQTGEVGTVTDVAGAHPVVETGTTQNGDVTVAFSKIFPDVTITSAADSVLVATSVSVIPSITPIPEPSPIGLAALALFAAMLLNTAAAIKYQNE